MSTYSGSIKQTDMDTVLEMLFFIPADDRDTWFRVGSAIKTLWGGNGFALFDEWSQTSPDHYRASSQRSQWRSFKPGVYGIGTIVYLARSHGYYGTKLSHKKIGKIAVNSESNNLRNEERKLARRAGKEARRMIDEAYMDTHAYLHAKGFPDTKRLCYTGMVKTRKGESFHVSRRLLVPVYGKKGNLQSAQLISVSGDKMFLPGGVMRGGRFAIGRGRHTWICEGLATALTLQKALDVLQPSNYKILVSFMASNILDVSVPDALVIADNDKPKPGQTWGVGERYARQSGCKWWQPSETGDLNDMYLAQGLSPVVSELREFVSAV